jgi:hypothetical protein
MNSENLGVRIMENGALDRKIWGLEVFKGKMPFSEGFWGHLWNIRVTGWLWRKRHKLLQNLGIF